LTKYSQEQKLLIQDLKRKISEQEQIIQSAALKRKRTPEPEQAKKQKQNTISEYLENTSEKPFSVNKVKKGLKSDEMEMKLEGYKFELKNSKLQFDCERCTALHKVFGDMYSKEEIKGLCVEHRREYEQPNSPSRNYQI